MSEKWKTLKTAWVGDIHLGHDKTPTEMILANLYRSFCPEAIEKLDILFFEGDIFDRLLMLPGEPVGPIRLFFIYLLRECLEKGVAIRAVKGTPSHDWDQCILLNQLNEEVFSNKVDIRYVDKLAIDYEEKWGLHVLYVPDEWRPTPEQTQEEVQDLLKTKGIEKVDIACMHGYFEPQMPAKLAHNAHDLDFYLGIVKYFIGIGHIHRYWRYEHIVASGSFDRTAHGEEEPKGFSLVELVNGEFGKPKVTFVENKGAKQWKTVDCRGLEIEEAKAAVAKTVKDLPAESAVRILVKPSDSVAAALPMFQGEYPQFTWSRKVKDSNTDSADADEQIVELASINRQVNVFSITPSNVVDLMKERPKVADSVLAGAAIEYLKKTVADN